MPDVEMDQSFLEIGRHCSEDSCRQLDFLPFKCPSCSLPFCSTHWRPPSGHSCPSYDPTVYDNRVPSCPLCSSPVPPRSSHASEDPNLSMDHHLEYDCVVLHPDKKKQKKPSNECQVQKCKTKLVVEIRCEKCKGRFCPSHRFERDHKCDGGESLRREQEAQRKSSGKGKGFGGLFKSSTSSTSGSSGAMRKSATSTTSGLSRERIDGMGQAGLAALRRAQQQAATKTNNFLNSTSSSSKPEQITIDDSDSSVEIVSHKPAAASTSSSKPDSSSKPTPSTSSSKPSAPPPMKASSKRAQAEQASARKALEARYEKGLLSEKEKLKFAEMKAEEAKGRSGKGGKKEGDTCGIM
ncbi:AN1-type zinc finger protein [Sporobolomyces salmoneus]|uniref:AN1-type zinc finger protein n=1 Tax=Sporobolomyces salmoneus TaxID=183962 RepID=UPI003175E52B